MSNQSIEMAPEQNVLTGTTEAHLCTWTDGVTLVHKEIAAPLAELFRAAAEEEINIQVVSGFRSFDRQLTIWNEKVSGKRPTLNHLEQQINLADLNDLQKIHTILRWSALPGASRHHWGTDIDIVDAKVIPANYAVKLTIDEARTLFSRMHNWLNESLTAFGFFRPYSIDRGGISPEPWHISYSPASNKLQSAYSLSLLRSVIERAENMALKEVVLDHLSELYDRYISKVDPFVLS